MMLQSRPHQVAKNQSRLEHRLNAVLKASVTPARKKNRVELVTGDGLKQADECPKCGDRADDRHHNTARNWSFF